MTDRPDEQLPEWATDAAMRVTCCAGPMCCERRIAEALVATRKEALEEAAEIADIHRQNCAACGCDGEQIAATIREQVAALEKERDEAREANERTEHLRSVAWDAYKNSESRLKVAVEALEDITQMRRHAAARASDALAAIRGPASESACHDYASKTTGFDPERMKRAQENEARINELEQRVADLNEVLEDKRRLTRELDVTLSGEGGAAKQASLCDLIGPARQLRDQVRTYQEREEEFLAEHDENVRLHTELESYQELVEWIFHKCSLASDPVAWTKVATFRRAQAAKAQAVAPYQGCDTNNPCGQRWCSSCQ